MKPVFMLYNKAANHFSLGDIFNVIGHGLPLDFSTAGYLMAFPLLMAIASLFLPSTKWWKHTLTVYFSITALLLAIILAVDCALYSFWQFKLDGTIFNYLDSPKLVLGSVSPLFVIIGILCILFIAALLFLALHKTLRSTPFPKANIVLTLPALLIFGGISFLLIRGGVGKSTMNIGNVYYSENQFLNHSAINPAFNLLASSLKEKDFDQMYRFYSKTEADSLYQPFVRPSQSVNPDTLLTTKRPNVLIIIMEGFAGTFVEPCGGAKGITPNFNRLAKEGVFFSQFYANSYRTDRGTVCILSGYPSFPKISPMKIPEKSRSLNSIAKSLNGIGYGTEFLYGGDINFTKMKSYLLSTGYQQAMGDTHFPRSVRKTHAWGVTDKIVFDTLYQRILSSSPQPGKWFTTFLTLASHEPWIVPYHRNGLDQRANSMAYLDDCLGRFVARLKKTPQWKNTLIICLPDHGIDYPKGITEADICKYHIPMLWLGGAVRNARNIKEVCSQQDLAAMLLGQMSLSHKGFPFSNDVLSQNRGCPFAMHTFDNGFAYIEKDSAYTAFDFNANHVLSSRPAPSEKRIGLGKLMLQKAIEDFSKR